MSTTQTFIADAVLFDMDGTLTDSISAVEAALTELASEAGRETAEVIAAAHGRRAIDFIALFKPHIMKSDLPEAVATFERRILHFADEYQQRLASLPSSPQTVPALSPAFTATNSSAGPSPNIPPLSLPAPPLLVLDEVSIEMHQIVTTIMPGAKVTTEQDIKIEMTNADRSIRSLPGVHAMIASLPEGQYAVATSGASTYAYGAMTRVGIVPPAVTITADDPRLRRGKPFPDPFILAAENLGYDPANCVVFEDSPSGIKAGVASGATVIAVCTSHQRHQIENCGAHFIVDNMEQVKCRQVNGKLEFTVEL